LPVNLPFFYGVIVTGHLVVEFYSPNAQAKARDWKKEITEAVAAAILNIKNNNNVKMFAEPEISVYFTFEDKKP
jgi:hypothetical protein